ncbi:MULTISPECIES: DMT family transporter [unclassified Chelatococcus]|uniref:DMT family transporter n=1 Tax=unclassified Chelatococcus TaxID=2638111 RepID=UPI001BCBDD5A|nr:DMT family transporter [Chelatococcus sp.]MBS7696871.1 DMT family transporter [Chelatococcus sp. YT9]MBX3558291.1 DMT family transporter [Chelatococcus sp.]
MKEATGVGAALLSSALGGTAIVASRHTAADVGAFMLGIIRFGVGFAVLLPVAILHRERWPPPQDWPAVMALGVLFFCLFPILFNFSVVYTTAARAALALATAPLLTMAVSALLKVEPLTPRKTAGVLVATAGVAVSLLSGLPGAPAGAWRGDLLMVGAALAMALYTVWSRAYVRRSGTLSFCAVGMGAGVLALFLIYSVLPAPDIRTGLLQASTSRIWTLVYLGVVCGAFMFILWAFALARTTPTRVVVTVTLNPVVAGLLAAFVLDEAVTWNLLVGLLAVACGILLATTANVRSGWKPRQR